MNDIFEWRKVTLDDYENILLKWWSDWDWRVAPLPCYLPSGIIVSKNGVDIYAGFLYLTGTRVAILEYIVSNKQATAEQKRGGLDKLIDIISIIAKNNNNVDTLFTSTNDMSFCNSLKKNGFAVGDVDVIQLTKKI